MPNISFGGLSRINNDLIPKTFVVLDPAKGGDDLGVTGMVNHLPSLKEKNINLAVCYHLAGYLVASGIQIAMTRCDDSNMGIQERVDKVNKLSPDFILSVSQAEENLYVPMLYRWGYDPQSELVATFLKKHLDNWNWLNEPVGINKRRIGVVGKTYAPCVHVGIGNITKWKEHANSFADPDFINDYARILATGLLESFTRVTWLSSKIRSH